MASFQLSYVHFNQTGDSLKCERYICRILYFKSKFFLVFKSEVMCRQQLSDKIRV